MGAQDNILFSFSQDSAPSSVGHLQESPPPLTCQSLRCIYEKPNGQALMSSEELPHARPMSPEQAGQALDACPGRSLRPEQRSGPHKGESTEPLLAHKVSLGTCEKHTSLGICQPSSRCMAQYMVDRLEFSPTCTGCSCAGNHWNHCDSPAHRKQQEKKKKKASGEGDKEEEERLPWPDPSQLSPTLFSLGPHRSFIQTGPHIAATVILIPPFDLNCLFISQPSFRAFSRHASVLSESRPSQVPLHQEAFPDTPSLWEVHNALQVCSLSEPWIFLTASVRLPFCGQVSSALWLQVCLTLHRALA